MIEEIFFNLCVGRKINLKKNDQSSIYNFLSKTDIEKKLNLNLRRKDLEKYLSKNNKKLVIKIPDVLHSLVFLQKYYPKNKFIVIKRDKKAIMSSLIKKNGLVKKISPIFIKMKIGLILNLIPNGSNLMRTKEQVFMLIILIHLQTK